MIKKLPEKGKTVDTVDRVWFRFKKKKKRKT